jgi:hypothetical protein
MKGSWRFWVVGQFPITQFFGRIRHVQFVADS